METRLDNKYKITQQFYEYAMKHYFTSKNVSLYDFKIQYMDNLSTNISFDKDYHELVFFLEKIYENAGDLFSYYHIPQKIFENGLYYLTKELINPIQENDLKQNFLVYKIKELRKELNDLKEDNETLTKDNEKLKQENQRLIEYNDTLETQLERREKKNKIISYIENQDSVYFPEGYTKVIRAWYGDPKCPFNCDTNGKDVTTIVQNLLQKSYFIVSNEVFQIVPNVNVLKVLIVIYSP